MQVFSSGNSPLSSGPDLDGSARTRVYYLSKKITYLGDASRSITLKELKEDASKEKIKRILADKRFGLVKFEGADEEHRLPTVVLDAKWTQRLSEDKITQMELRKNNGESELFNPPEGRPLEIQTLTQKETQFLIHFVSEALLVLDKRKGKVEIKETEKSKEEPTLSLPSDEGKTIPYQKGERRIRVSSASMSREQATSELIAALLNSMSKARNAQETREEEKREEATELKQRVLKEDLLQHERIASNIQHDALSHDTTFPERLQH